MQDAVELILLFILFQKYKHARILFTWEDSALFLFEGNEHTKNENRYFLAPAQKNWMHLSIINSYLYTSEKLKEYYIYYREHEYYFRFYMYITYVYLMIFLWTIWVCIFMIRRKKCYEIGFIYFQKSDIVIVQGNSPIRSL